MAANRAAHASPGDPFAATPPSSDAGEIEEARAALLGDRYWVQISTPIYAHRASASKAADPNRPDMSDDEVSLPISLPLYSTHSVTLTGTGLFYPL